MIWDLILERFVTLRILEFIHGICQIHAEKMIISSYGCNKVVTDILANLSFLLIWIIQLTHNLFLFQVWSRSSPIIWQKQDTENNLEK